jgi:hypothetical protein
MSERSHRLRTSHSGAVCVAQRSATVDNETRHSRYGRLDLSTHAFDGYGESFPALPQERLTAARPAGTAARLRSASMRFGSPGGGAGVSAGRGGCGQRYRSPGAVCGQHRNNTDGTALSVHGGTACFSDQGRVSRSPCTGETRANVLLGAGTPGRDRHYGKCHCPGELPVPPCPLNSGFRLGRRG